nr:hypothetical protein [Mycoplasmopsis bovis]
MLTNSPIIKAYDTHEENPEPIASKNLPTETCPEYVSNGITLVPLNFWKAANIGLANPTNAPDPIWSNKTPIIAFIVPMMVPENPLPRIK